MGFTFKQVESLKPKDKTYQVREGKGFGIRVFPSGQKTWVYAYKYHERQRTMTLGPYPEVKLADARERHRHARELLLNGVDPLNAKERERNEPTVAEMVDEFLSRHVKEKAPRSLKEYRRNLEKDVIPAWGNIRVKDITRRDVHILLERVLDRGAKNQANQVFKIVRAMFNWAVPRYDLDYSPCSHVKLPSKENKKDRFLTDVEIVALWNGLEMVSMSDSMKRVLKLILVTGQRPGEVIGMHRREFDDCWWTIPAERAKNGKEHRVYLTSLALQALTNLPDGYLFPSPRTEKPIEVNAIARAVRRSSKWSHENLEKDETSRHLFSIETPWTPHDLRRTCATNLGEMGFTDEVIGHILNHTRPGVTSRYNRHGYDQEKRKALEAWDGKLRHLLEGSGKNVIPFR